MTDRNCHDQLNRVDSSMNNTYQLTRGNMTIRKRHAQGVCILLATRYQHLLKLFHVVARQTHFHHEHILDDAKYIPNRRVQHDLTTIKTAMAHSKRELE